MNEPRPWILEMESPPGKTLKIVEMTTADLEYHINFIAKAEAGFKRIDRNFGQSVSRGQSAIELHSMLQRNHS